MPAYIAMLRGVNVSAQKKVNMKQLKSLFESLGFENVQTYIQSGNVVFESGKEPAGVLIARIEKGIEGEFGFNVPVIIRDRKEMEHIFKKNPFLEEGEDIEKLHVTFLSAEPAKELLQKAANTVSGDDRFVTLGKEIYLCCTNGYGTTKFNNNFFESKLKLQATTRNWKSVSKLLEMAGGGNNEM